MTSARLILAGLFACLTLVACGTVPREQEARPVDPATPAAGQQATTVSGPAGAPDAISEPPQAPPVPELLRFEAKTVDGEVFEGATLFGTPAVLWFWAPWCPTCQAEAPTIAEAAKIEGVRFVGVAAQDQVPAMREFVDRFGLGTFPHIADTGAEIWKRFGVTYQPAFAFVGADGSVEVETDLIEPAELMNRVRALR